MPHNLYLLLNLRSDCYWRPERMRYTRDLSAAGLYTEADARRFARPDPENRDVAIPLSEKIDEIRGIARRAGLLLDVYEAGR